MAGGGGRRKILKVFCDFGFVGDYFFGSFEQVNLNLVAKILNDGWLEGRRKVLIFFAFDFGFALRTSLQRF